jgi:aminopeptidase N
VLHALRHLVGDTAFFTIVRRWVAEHRGGNGSTAAFEVLVGLVAGSGAASSLDRWLTSTTTNGYPA